MSHFTNGNLDKKVNHGQSPFLLTDNRNKTGVGGFAHYNLIADKWGERGLSAHWRQLTKANLIRNVVALDCWTMELWTMEQQAALGTARTLPAVITA